MEAIALAQAAPTITRAPDHLRDGVLDHFFRTYSGLVESRVYELAAKVIPGYGPCVWDFFMLSNGGIFMVPLIGHEQFCVYFEGSDSVVELSAQAAGLAICLKTYRDLSEEQGSRFLQFHYDWLQDFILTHPERQSILQILE